MTTNRFSVKQTRFSLAILLLSLLQGVIQGFLVPRNHHQFTLAKTNASSLTSLNRNVACHVFPPNSSLFPSLINAEETGAFTDKIDYFGDPLIQTMFGGFGVILLLLVAANALLGQMDSAIEKVLVDFEEVMRESYPTRWVDISEQLDGLDSDERQAKLIQIMEDLQKKDPEFMERVNKKMG